TARRARPLHLPPSRPPDESSSTMKPIRVLMITSAWPTPGQPRTTHFIKRQADFLRAAGVAVDVFQFRGEQKLNRYVGGWLRARRQLDPTRYDLVHAQFGQSGLLALPKRLPLVVTFRGSDLLGIVSDVDGRYTWKGRVLQRLSRLVALHALKLPLDRRYVLFVGNPAQARKRHALARRAVEIVNHSCPVELVTAWGAPHTDVPLYMNACDALICTSSQEGSPNVVKEALA